MANFTLPSPDRQVYIHAFLESARPTVLHAAVRSAVQSISPATLSTELQTYAPAHGLALLQGTNIRDELVFAAPSVLRAAPFTLGYYRLLLGVSQKQFYTAASGLRPFMSMEESGVIRPASDVDIPAVCRDLNTAIAVLLQAIPPGSLGDDVNQLPLMTLGAQADGSWRNMIGAKATLQVYEALKAVIKGTGHTYVDLGTSLNVKNSSGREVIIALAADPDVEIRERLGSTDFLRAAIEIKGGRDYANIHNRAGEAEKSHRKAKARGAGQFWTIIACAKADMKMLRAESPTTDQWFDIEQVETGAGPDWDKLVSHVRVAMGI